MNRSAPLWIITVLGLMLAVGWVGGRLIPSTPSATNTQGEALIGGHFELVNSEGKTVTEKDFTGQYMLVFFGFTHCPGICPTTLLLMQNALESLGDTAKKITPVFVTVDPARDTPTVVGDYVAKFDPRMVGLTGSAAQIDRAMNGYKVFSSKVENASENYDMDHSAFMYLMGPDGKYITHFPATISESQLKDGLARAVK